MSLDDSHTYGRFIAICGMILVMDALSPRSLEDMRNDLKKRCEAFKNQVAQHKQKLEAQQETSTFPLTLGV